MTNVNIEKYAKTGEFRATLDFHKKDVDWNMITKQIHSGCHCIWVESDLESYIRIHGHDVSCVEYVLNKLYLYLFLSIQPLMTLSASLK